MEPTAKAVLLQNLSTLINIKATSLKQKIIIFNCPLALLIFSAEGIKKSPFQNISILKRGQLCPNLRLPSPKPINKKSLAALSARLQCQ